MWTKEKLMLLEKEEEEYENKLMKCSTIKFKIKHLVHINF